MVLFGCYRRRWRAVKETKSAEGINGSAAAGTYWQHPERPGSGRVRGTACRQSPESARPIRLGELVGTVAAGEQRRRHRAGPAARRPFAARLSRRTGAAWSCPGSPGGFGRTPSRLEHLDRRPGRPRPAARRSRAVEGWRRPGTAASRCRPPAGRPRPGRQRMRVQLATAIRRPASPRTGLNQARQVDVETRAAARLAGALDPALVLFDDAKHHRQTQAGALAERRGGEKRVEDTRQIFIGEMPVPVSATRGRTKAPARSTPPGRECVPPPRVWLLVSSSSRPPSGMALIFRTHSSTNS